MNRGKHPHDRSSATQARKWRLLACGLAAVVALGASTTTAPGGQQPHGKRYCPTTGKDRLDTRVLHTRAHFKAVRIARRHDCELRVIKRGNRWLDITGGLRTNRVNVGLRDGRVKKVYGTF